MDDLVRLHELRQSGLCCAQAIMQLALECRGEEDPGLIRALGGLCNGMGQGLVCGALSGAACMLSYIDAKAARTEIIPRLTEWFKDEYGANGINCDDILEGDHHNHIRICPSLIDNVYREAKELLEEYGYDLPARGDD